jgi:hypothetical protein
MKKKLLLLAALFISFSYAKAQSKSEQMKWILGVWKIATANGTIVESWRQLNDSTLQGKSVFVKSKGDTIPQESIELAYRNGDWYYIPTVQGQNNNQPVFIQNNIPQGR